MTVLVLSSAWAYDFGAVAPTGQRLFYNITSSTSPYTVSVTYPSPSYDWSDYAEPTGSLTIPSTVTYSGITYSVTSIGEAAFEGCSGLTSLTIPNSVTAIEGYVFNGCSGLTSVTIPDSVTSIGEGAFWNCSGLTSVTIPNSVTSIGSYAFFYCSGLTSVTIGNSVTSIGSSAFENCSGLHTIYSLNPTAPTLGFLCFNGCPIQEVQIPCGSMVSYSSRWGASLGDYLQEPNVPFVRTLLSDNDTMGNVTLLSHYCADTSTILATPNYGYHFTLWSDGDTTNPRTFVLTQDTTFTAEFDRNSYAVTGVAGDASLGQVQGGGSFLYLDTIVLTATAVDHYHFTHWQDGNTENPRSIVVYSDLVFTAQFAIDTQHIVVVSSDINMGYVSGGGDIIYGQPVTVSATAYSGYHFSCWSNGSRYNPYTFAAIQDLTLSAVFVSDEAPFYTITVAANNAAMGHVEGSGTYDDGTVALITATPSEGCQFLHWSDGSTEAQHLVTISATATYTAYFAPESCSVTTETNDANAGVVSGDGIYYMGDTLSLTAAANEGYRFTHWSDGSTDAVRSIVVDENLSGAMQSLGGGAYGITFTAYFENGTEGIEMVQKSYTLTVVGNAIRISGAMGETVRVFDVVGRQLLTKKLDREEIRLDQTGVFFVQVGNAPAEKVVLVR